MLSCLAMARKDIWKNWTTTRADIQRHWNQLTPHDLEMIDGDREQLVVRIVDRYGIAREWADHQVTQWENGKS